MPNLNRGSKTYRNLKDAFGIESEASCRYLYFARRADIEGYPDVGGLFRDRAEAEMDHAHGHLDYLKAVGDPATESPIGSTSKNLGAAVAGETYAYTKMYPGMARIARDEGFTDVAGRVRFDQDGMGGEGVTGTYLGRTVSATITAPSGPAQGELIRTALRSAGIF